MPDSMEVDQPMDDGEVTSVTETSVICEETRLTVVSNHLNQWTQLQLVATRQTEEAKMN